MRMRINISVPNELHEAMQAVAVRVNWSAVAQAAFRLHLQTGAAETQSQPVISRKALKVLLAKLQQEGDSNSQRS